jgi:hypothetical protein
MSLKDIDNEDGVEEFVNSKRKKKNLIKLPPQTKTYLVLIIFGIIIGILIGNYYLSPILNTQDSLTYNQCVSIKDALTKENDCLYNHIEEANIVVKNCAS